MELNFSAEHALPLIILLPFAGALFNGITGRKESRTLVIGVAISAVALAFGLALLSFVTLATHRASDPAFVLVADVYRWFSVSLNSNQAADVNIRLLMDPLSGVMTLVITGIGLLIHIYSASYMSEEPSYARFFTYLNLFTGSMLVLVLADNLPLMFVGWEGVGLCSYLLIGFWFENPEYAAAGRKAFIYNRVGDFGVLLGMFLLVSVVGSFDFAKINDAATAIAATPMQWGSYNLGMSVATAACLALFLGCTGKSAQLPLFVWLPDAMAGPTPVSALIHAATMVTAGVYLMCRLSPLFAASQAAMAVIAVVGALTALIAASIALVQKQLKKILAYSTVSQLGFMVAAVGVGAFAAGIFHVFTHAFFKACLFLGAGSVMHAVHAHGDASLDELGGLRKVMPHTHWTFAISTAAIAGLPPLSGFFSKDEILAAAGIADFPAATWLGPVVFTMLVIAATMTAFYMFRLYFLTFAGEYRGHAHPHESGAAITVPLSILAVGAALVGFLGLPHAWHLPNLWTTWLGGTIAELSHGEGEHVAGLSPHLVMAIGITASLSGIGLAAMFYRTGQTSPTLERLANNSQRLYAFLLDKWRIDEFYGALIIRPARKLAEFAAILDRVLVDGLLTRLSAAIVRVVGFLLTRVQTGRIYAYSTAFALGLAFVSWWFLYPHIDLEVQPTSAREVAYSVGRGIGYSYRWDFNADGVFDTEWDAEGANQKHEFAEGQRRGLALRLTSAAPYRRTQEYRLHRGQAVVLDVGLLGDAWSTQRAPLPPALKLTPEGLTLRPNGAQLRGVVATGPEVKLNLGDELMLGEARVQVGAWIKSTVEVKNAFGNVKRKATDVVLLPSPTNKAELAAR